MILLVGMVSAWEWDNVKSYDEEKRTVTLKNFFGLGKDIATVQLLTELEINIETGYQKFAEYNVSGKIDLNDLFYGDTKTYDKNKYDKGEEIELGRKIDLKYLETYYEEVITYNYIALENGTIIRENSQSKVELIKRTRWTEFNKLNKLKKDEVITIGLFTNAKQGDYIEWIPTFAGIEINEWASFVVTSGSQTIDGDYTVVTFTSSGYFNLTGDTLNTSVLIVAGGGGGGLGFGGGGGGAGGLIFNGSRNVTAGNYTVTVGLGGNPGRVGLTNGRSGLDSVFNGTTAVGGGGGGSYNGNVGFDGGSSGGGAQVSGSPGSETAGQGNSGGDGGSGSGAGGGGFSTVGVDGNVGVAGGGGNGTTHLIFNGTPLYYSGGGGGGGLTGGENGLGGGGLGGNFEASPSTAGVNGTGGGGGGGVLTGGEFPSRGGNGIIIIRYLTPILTPFVSLNSPIDHFNATSPTITFNGTILANIPTNVSLIINDVYNETNTTGILGNYIFTKILSNGIHTWNYESCNVNGCVNGTERTLTIDSTMPNIVIESPVGNIDLLYQNKNITLNFTVTDDFSSLDTCLLDYNNTNATVSCINATKTNTNFSYQLEFDNLTIYANDSFGNIGSSFTSWDFKFLELNQTFNNDTTEGNLEDYFAVGKLGTGLTISQANLFYNGSSEGGDIFPIGDIVVLRKLNLVVPSLEQDLNLTFFWNIILSDSTNINLTSNNQTVNNLDADNCGVFTNEILNFTLLDEETQVQLNNVTIETAMDLFSGDESQIVISHSEISNVNPTRICLNVNLTSSSNYFMDVVVRYENPTSAIEYFNIVKFVVNSSTLRQDINLFDLNLSDSTEFLITFKGEDFQFIEDALIFIDRQYISENNTFKTVELPKTDSNGQTVGHFVRNDVVYNLRAIKDNVLLGSFNNIIAFCTDFTIGDCVIVLEVTPSGLVTFNYDEELGLLFESVPSFNNDTRTMSFSFSTTDGTPSTVFMSVERKDIFGNSTLCNNTITSSSGTLSCSIPSNLDDTFLETTVFADGVLVVQSNTSLDSSKYGNLGFVLWFFLTLSLVLVFKDKTEVLLGLLISFIGAIALGITSGSIIGLGSAGVWILIIVLVGIWKLNSERPQ